MGFGPGKRESVDVKDTILLNSLKEKILKILNLASKRLENSLTAAASTMEIYEVYKNYIQSISEVRQLIISEMRHTITFLLEFGTKLSREYESGMIKSIDGEWNDTGKIGAHRLYESLSRCPPTSMERSWKKTPLVHYTGYERDEQSAAEQIQMDISEKKASPVTTCTEQKHQSQIFTDQRGEKTEESSTGKKQPNLLHGGSERGENSAGGQSVMESCVKEASPPSGNTEQILAKGTPPNAESPKFVDPQKYKVRKKVKIGACGGEVQLYVCKIAFPQNAVKQDTEFGVSIDNNPSNYPKDKFPIASILDIDPSMDFEEPVSVTMRTWLSARKGRHLDAQILQRLENGKWVDDRDIVLSDKNEVCFDVWHFSGKTAVVKKESDVDDGDVHLFNCVYMLRGTGAIISMFCKDEPEMEKAEQKYLGGFKKVLACPAEIRGRSTSLFEVRVECIDPEGVNYINKQNVSAKFRGYEALRSKRLTCYFRALNFPRKYNGQFSADYFVTVPDDKENEFYAVLSLEEQSATQLPSGDHTNITVIKHESNKNQTGVQIVDNGGTLHSTQYDSKSSLIAKTSQGD